MPSITITDKQQQLLAAVVKRTKVDWKDIAEELADTTPHQANCNWNHLRPKLMMGVDDTGAAKTRAKTRKRKSSGEDGTRVAKQGRKKLTPPTEEDDEDIEIPASKKVKKVKKKSKAAVEEDTEEVLGLESFMVSDEKVKKHKKKAKQQAEEDIEEDEGLTGFIVADSDDDLV